MRKMILFLCAAGVASCCPCRKAPLVEERRIYVFDRSSSSPEWTPRTHRDSLLWGASKKAKQQCDPLIQDYLDAESESFQQLLLKLNHAYEKRTSR